MLGYIVAGIIIGPTCLGLIDETKSIVELGEIGITLLLFVVGLELSPMRLKALRSSILTLGGSQVIVTTLLFSGVSYYFGQSLVSSLVIGLALSLSSTAFALSYLTNRGQLTNGHGQISLSILLFQDIVIVPILAILPLMQLGDSSVAQINWTMVLAKGVGVAALVAFCMYPLKQVISLVRGTQDSEIILGAFLFFIISMSMGMEKLGFTMSIGAFIAGVSLANSEVKSDLYRTITPFKGILMGLFFMTLGIDMNFSYIAGNSISVAAIVFGIFALKAIALFAISALKATNKKSMLKVSLLLFQTGEFGIVVLERAGNLNIINEATTQMLGTSVLLTMVISPLILRVTEIAANYAQAPVAETSVASTENVIPLRPSEEIETFKEVA
jgi:Kef-type K+ transport system membrane component KefB